MKQNRFVCIVILLFTCLLIFISCGKIEEFIPTAEHEVLYFYGVIKSGGKYYACVLTSYQEAPSKEELRHIPLADKLVASFQEIGLVGAWNPTEYHTPSELKKAYLNEKIVHGTSFRYGMKNGYLEYLYEESYYEDFDVTGN